MLYNINKHEANISNNERTTKCHKNVKCHNITRNKKDKFRVKLSKEDTFLKRKECKVIQDSLG